MSDVFHPRPNPIVAAMYTARDMNVDVIVMHGPAGCSFMASRPLENAGVRVITSSMKDNDLIFGGGDSLEKALIEAKERFSPKTMAVIGLAPALSLVTTSRLSSAGSIWAIPTALPSTATAAWTTTPKEQYAP